MKLFHLNKFLIFFFLFTLASGLNAQKKNLDSIGLALQKMPDDTVKAKNLSTLVRDFYNYGEFKKLKYYDSLLKLTAIQLCKSGNVALIRNGRVSFTRYFAIQGSVAMKEFNYRLATSLYDSAMVWAQKSGDKVAIAFIYGNMGIIFKQQAMYPKALEKYFLALKMLQEADNKRGIIANLGNIGNIYKTMGEFAKAKQYYLESDDYCLKWGDKDDIANSYTRLGNIYEIEKNYEKAFHYYDDAIKIVEKTGNLILLSEAIGNLAFMYDGKGEYDKALQNYFRAAEIDKKLGKQNALCIQYENIAGIYLAKKQDKKAEEFYLMSMKIAKEIDDLDGIRSLSLNLSKMYERNGDFTRALENYKAYIAARDSIFNEENTKKMVRTEMNFDFEKKEAASKLEQEKKEAVSAAESKKQKIIIWSVCGILILVIAFAVFAYRSYLQKQKANIEITKQKLIIEVKQHEILDSIRYAKRIQTALMPSEKYIGRNLKELMNKL